MSTKSDRRPAEAAGHGEAEVDVFIVGIVRDAQREGEGLGWGDEGRLSSQRGCNQSFTLSVSTHIFKPRTEQVVMKIEVLECGDVMV